MRNFLKKLKEERGFTLVEMAVVIIIIAALLLLIIPNISNATKNVDSTTSAGVKSTVESQAILYEMNEVGSEPTLAELQKEGYLKPSQVEAYEKLPLDERTILSGE